MLFHLLNQIVNMKFKKKLCTSAFAIGELRELLFLFLITFPIFAQDSLLTQKDTLTHITPIPFVGTLENSSSLNTISNTQLLWNNERSLSDILQTQSGIYVRDLGSFGKDHQITLNGIDTRGIAFFIDGIQQNNFITGNYNLYTLSTEAIEKIEYISGTEASIYGINSPGGAINLITKNFYTNKPYSRLHYSQGINGYSQTDALFSQNIFNRFNFTFELSRSTYGTNNAENNYRARFPNENYDGWNFRTKLRYNISNTFNILFSHNYNKMWNGLNGGINRSISPNIYDELNAEVYNTDAFEKKIEHNFNLTTATHLFNDSLQLTTLSLFYINSLREYRDEENRTDGNGIFIASNHQTANLGGVLKHQWSSSFHNFLFSAETQLIEIEKSANIGKVSGKKFSASAKEEIIFLQPFTFSVFGRFDNIFERNALSFGANLNFTLTKNISLFGGYSSSERVPTLQELYWDTIPLQTQRSLKNEEHTLFESGLQFSLENFFQGKISYSNRTIQFPIIIIEQKTEEQISHLQVLQSTTRTYNAINVNFNTHYKQFFLDGSISYLHQSKFLYDDIPLTLTPQLYADASLYFRDTLFNNNLDLKIGLRSKYISEQTGMKPFDEANIFVPSIESIFGPSAATDFFVMGKIGDAYIHFMWENIFGVQYMLTPVYPMYSSNIRFGVSWEFWN